MQANHYYSQIIFNHINHSSDILLNTHTHQLTEAFFHGAVSLVNASFANEKFTDSELLLLFIVVVVRFVVKLSVDGIEQLPLL